MNETEFCEIVDCPNRALIRVGSDMKFVCFEHAKQYQKDLAERVKRDYS